MSESSSSLPPPAANSSYESHGIYEEGSTSVEFRGRRVSKIEGTETKQSILQRIRYGTQGTLATVAAVPAALVTAPFSLRTAKNLFKTPAKDWVAKRAIGGTHTSAPTYTYNKRAEKDYYSGKAFDPTSRQSIKDHLNKPEIRDRLRDANGHTYLIVPQMGGFIFCPDGDLSNPSFIKVWKTETGETITSANALQKNCRAYLVAYNPTQEEIGRMAADQGFTPDINVITFHWTQRMITCHNMNSFPLDKEISWRSGMHVKISDDDWKEMERFWNKKETDQKQELNGEKTFSDSKKSKRKRHSRAHSTGSPRGTQRRHDDFRSFRPTIMGGSSYGSSSSESESSSEEEES